jgi:DNA polymerase III sliding clamp (beta) subunit (PCNA family)
MGFNGTIALSSPIDLDIEATPKAIPFVKAIERCQSETTVVHMTPAGKLALKSGGFKAFVECTEEYEVLDAIQPEGEEIDLGTGLLAAFGILEGFISTDASRPWAMGILLRDYSAYATNNIILAEYWLGAPMPGINMPASAIAELNRIGEEPVAVRLGDRSVTFFFEGDRWLRSQLLNTEWPDISSLLDRASAEGDFDPFPDGLFEAIETVVPFVEEEGRIYFRPGRVSTSPFDGEGASIDLPNVPEHGAFHHKHLMSLQRIVSKIDFSKHPAPCPFNGKKLRGVILGMNDEG